MVQDAHVPGRSSAPILTTANPSLCHDPVMEPVARRFHQDRDAFAKAFSRAWFKLTHRALEPRALYLGADVPEEVQIWQDPVPALDHPMIGAAEIQALKQQVLATGCSVGTLVATAWGCFNVPWIRSPRWCKWRPDTFATSKHIGGE